MCTVTYIPAGAGFYLTSNRDEKRTRKPARKPAAYTVNGTNLIFPKDAAAEGTWIAMKENGDALCLLNGAFEGHLPQPPYLRSRGLVVLAIASQKIMAEGFNQADLFKIEPFTLIIAEQGRLYECRWDGAQKFFRQLPEDQAHIWSSATLYPRATRLKRKQWFDDWRIKNPNPAQIDIFKFHTKTGDGDVQNDLVMNRNNETFTVSITCIYARPHTVSIQYQDLLQNETSTIAFKQNQHSY